MTPSRKNTHKPMRINRAPTHKAKPATPQCNRCHTRPTPENTTTLLLSCTGNTTHEQIYCNPCATLHTPIPHTTQCPCNNTILDWAIHTPHQGTLTSW